jgi:tyrosine-protein phosphatase YwqE
MKNIKLMLSLFKKRPSDPSGALAGLGCDIHSHLIPGVDDGSPDMETTLRLIRGLMGLGYKKIITTPHVNGDIFPNTPENIRAGRDAVNAALRDHGIDICFHAAAEYLMDDRFARALDAGESFLTLKDNLILVELSFAVPAINLKELLFQLQVKGYQPILAHPERYLYFGANKGWYDQIRDTGCLFQLNLLSLTGYYGKDARQLAEYLLKKGYFHFLGTDLHHERHLHALRSSRHLFQTVDRLLQTGQIQNPRL